MADIDEGSSGDTVARGAPFTPRRAPMVIGELERTSLEEVLTQVICARSTGRSRCRTLGRDPRASS